MEVFIGTRAKEANKSILAATMETISMWMNRDRARNHTTLFHEWRLNSLEEEVVPTCYRYTFP